MIHDGGAGGARGVQDGQDVLGGGVVRVVELLEGAPVLADGVAARVECHQDLVEVGGGFTHSFAFSAHPLGHRGQHRVQLYRIDHLEQVDDVFEDRVDLGADVLRMQHRSGGQPLGARVLRIHQLDELSAERGGGTDLCLHVGRDIPDLIGVDLQPQAGPVVAFADLADPADLDTPQHDLGVGLQHQPRSIRRQGHRHIRPERAGEGRRGNEQEHGDCRQQDHRPPRGGDAVFASPTFHATSSPDGSCRTGRRRRA